MKKIIKSLSKFTFIAAYLMSTQTRAMAQDVDLSGLEDELLSIEKSQMINVEAISKLTDEAAASDANLDDVVTNEYVTDEVKSGLSGLQKMNDENISSKDTSDLPKVKTRRVRSR